MKLEEIQPHRGDIVALDFDGTMTNGPSLIEEGDCEIDLSLMLNSSGHANFLRELKQLDGDEAGLFKKYDHFNQLYLGRREGEIKNAGRAIGRMYNQENRWNQQIMRIIDRANSANAHVYIITASGQALVKAITKEANIRVKAVLGKTFVTNRQGFNTSVSFHPRGEKKIQVLAKHLGGQPLIHVACGDSATSDGPMLRRAQHGFLRNLTTGLFEPIAK